MFNLLELVNCEGEKLENTVKDVTVGFRNFVRARFVNNFKDEDICVACDMRSVCSSCPWQTPQVRK